MPDEIDLVDPERRYGCEGLTSAERMALRILNLFPQASLSRTRDVIQIDIGGLAGCVLLITSEIVELRLATIEWTAGCIRPA